MGYLMWYLSARSGNLYRGVYRGNIAITSKSDLILIIIQRVLEVAEGDA